MAASPGPATVDELLVEQRGPVGWITLNRPATRNALCPSLLERLLAALDWAAAAAEVRVVALTGAGGAFCSGADLGWLDKKRNEQSARELMRSFHRLVRVINEYPKPLIAAVDGAATGAGWNLALLCDVVIASERARFSQPFVRLGLITDLGGAHSLLQAAGRLAARELVLSARQIDAVEACRLGLVNRTVPAERLQEEVQALGEEIALGTPLALRLTRRLARAAEVGSLEEILEEEVEAQARCLASPEHTDALLAFQARRAANAGKPPSKAAPARRHDRRGVRIETSAQPKSRTAG